MDHFIKKSVLPMLLVSAIFASSVLTVTWSEAQGSQIISSSGSISYSTVSTVFLNGIWLQTTEATEANCDNYVANNITNLYIQYGEWTSSNSITTLFSAAQVETAVANAHAKGLKIFPWVLSGSGSPIDLSTPQKRTTAINAMISVINTYGFDGFDDDIESFDWSSYQNLVTYYNAATVAMHAIGKKYFTAIITYWATGMGSSLFSTINVDALQPMLYGFPDPVETNFKSKMDFVLTYTTSPIHLAIHSDGPYQAFADSMAWIDEQIAAGTPTNKLTGIEIFWQVDMDASQWTAWGNWALKDSTAPPPTTTGENLMWMQDYGDILNKPDINAALQDLRNKNFTEIAVCDSAWCTPSQGYWWGTVNSNATLFCNYAHANGFTVYYFLYGESIDISTSAIRSARAANISQILSLGFDGYIDDIESWTGTDSDIAAQWNLFATTCHNVGKIGGLYYKLEYPYTDESTILPLLTSLDFIVTRFSPITTYNVTMYNQVLSYCPCPWMAQVRTTTSSGGVETLQNSVDFYNTEFAGGIPNSFRGFTLWAYLYVTSSEWTLWNSWTLKDFTP
jgi:hypothetical protein